MRNKFTHLNLRTTLLLAAIMLMAILLVQTARPMLVAAAPTAAMTIDWDVFGHGIGTMSSSSFQMTSTIGQPIIYESSSSSFQFSHGFWIRLQETWRVLLPTIIR